jgi:energy-coupling factor transporter ATP-binding protein EcfA2
MQKNPASGHFKLVLLFLGATIGVPVATGAAFRDWAFQHPLLAAGLVVLYELAILLAGLITGLAKDVWKEQRPALVSWLNLRVVWLYSSYYREYRKHLLNRERDLDMKGTGIRGALTLELGEIFIELRLAYKAPVQVSPNPIPKVVDLFVSKSDTHSQKLPEVRSLIWDYLHHERHLAILGAPGSGKTTLLQHITLTLLERKKRRRVKAPPKLPILLALRDHWRDIAATPTISLSDIAHADLKRQRHEPPQGWFEHQLKQGRCLVLLDGLDEVSNQEARQQVVDWVEAQIQTYDDTRFLLTSRPFGYPKDRFRGVSVLEVQPFSGEQISQFIYNWYLANETTGSKKRNDLVVRDRAEKGAQELLNRLYDTPALLELAVNPLLLTMTVTIHRHYGALPGSRSDLYAKACEAFAWKRHESKSIPLELKPTQMQSVLQPLAYHLTCTNTLEISSIDVQQVIAKPLADVHPNMAVFDFLRYVEDASGLLVECRPGFYSFAHKTFQEYLTAVHVEKQHLEQELLDQVTKDTWQEIIRLYAAQNNATNIVRACLKAQAISPVALSLAFDLLEEGQAIAPNERIEVLQLLEQGAEDKDPERQRLVAEALLTRRLRQTQYRLDEERYLATSLITCAEYQLFLDEQRAQGKWLQPDRWMNWHFPPGQGRMPVLGVRATDAEAFCEWLTEREGGGWRYRLPSNEEVFQGSSHQGLAEMMNFGVGFWATGATIHYKDANTSRFLTREIVQKYLAEDIDNFLHLDRAPHLDHAPHYNFALDRIFAFVRTLVRNHDRGIDRTLQLNFNLERALYLDSLYGLSLDHVRARASTLGLDNVLSIDLYRDLGGTVVLALDRDLARFNKAMPFAEVIRLLRLLVRLSSLGVIGFCVFELAEAPVQRRRRKLFCIGKTIHRDEEEDILRLTINTYQNLYVDFATLEARIAGTLQPFEGILFVKERAQGSIAGGNTATKGSVRHYTDGPKDIDGARQLAMSDPYQFERWVLSLVACHNRFDM